MSAVGAGRGARASSLPHPDPGVILLPPVRRDHARGNAELARLRPGLAVLGADERICALTRRLVHGEELRVSARPGGRGIALGPPASPAARPSAAVWGHPRALSPDSGPHLRPHELLPVGRGVSGSARGVLGYWLPRPTSPASL